MTADQIPQSSIADINSGDLANLFILIVDDEPSIRKMLQRTLDGEGFITATASNGLEALQLLQDLAVALVVTDITMPKMDGLELTRTIKTRFDADVIVITGQTHAYHYEELIHLGASDFIEKPINRKELVMRIKRVLNERQLRAELVRYHQELAQAQKLESIGLLAAGIAHEINTPIQYIGDNTDFLKESFAELLSSIEAFQTFYDLARHGKTDAQSLDTLGEVLEESDLEYLREEIPLAIEQSMDGVRRVQKIVKSMKEFSHPGSDEKAMADIHHTIENTVTVTTNEWKYCAEIAMDFVEDMPPIYCDASAMSQVFLNMIINGTHAIMEKAGPEPTEKGKITISTTKDDTWAEIRISDTGTGIPQENIQKVFDPFFTTKEVGKGTGQGLAISRSVVEDMHQGKLEIKTREGQGTSFIIKLPLTNP